MEEKYIIHNKEKLYNFFGESKLFVIIEIFFNDLTKRIKPIKIQKNMTINDLPNKFTDLFKYNEKIPFLFETMREYNLNCNDNIYKNLIDIIIIIFDDSSENKIKLTYNSHIIP